MKFNSQKTHANNSRKKPRRLGLLAAILWPLGRGKSPKPGPEDYKKADHSGSTQRMGIRFTEKVRDVFRFRWIKSRHNR